jgi:hypothetical protein
MDIEWLFSPPDIIYDSKEERYDDAIVVLRNVGRCMRFNFLQLTGTWPWYDAMGEVVFLKSHSLITSSSPASFYDECTQQKFE